jgi:hypothetical protein
MASVQGTLSLLYPVEKSDSGYLASYQKTSFGHPDAFSFSERLLRGLTLLLQKGPGKLIGFPYQEIRDTFSMILSICHH